ncbi:unnamed protein product [Blepharisma stoltei]|uniref:Uncharacterized protein n=1 Tax=Blepharisma stoltei TaxID=1481888 RepID=A0AAU9KFT8_9CILI|nr:unnamed protein product [Blepharisma stoltei]
MFTAGGFFNFAWMIVGSVWEFESDGCYDDFYNGWALTLAILIVDYVSIGLVCCLLSCFCICSGAVIFGMSKLNKDIMLEELEKNLKEAQKEMQKEVERERENLAKANAELNKKEGQEENQA